MIRVAERRTNIEDGGDLWRGICSWHEEPTRSAEHSANVAAYSASRSGTDGDRFRRNRVRYDTPTFAGFTASASWGEDDDYDIALRYAKEFNGLRVAAAAIHIIYPNPQAKYIIPVTPPLTLFGRRYSIVGYRSQQCSILERDRVDGID